MSLLLIFPMGSTATPGGGETPPPVTTEPDVSGKVSVFAGDSITWMANASDDAHSWKALLSTAKGWAAPLNIATSGQVLQDLTPNTTNCFIRSDAPYKDKDDIPQYDSSIHGLLFLPYGTNDMNYNIAQSTPANFQAACEAIADFAKNTKGWPYARQVFPSIFNTYLSSAEGPEVTETRRIAFRNAARAAALAKGSIFIDFYNKSKNYNTVNRVAFTSQVDQNDYLHPLNAGHQLYADIAAAHTYVPYTGTGDEAQRGSTESGTYADLTLANKQSGSASYWTNNSQIFTANYNSQNPAQDTKKIPAGQPGRILCKIADSTCYGNGVGFSKTAGVSDPGTWSFMAQMIDIKRLFCSAAGVGTNTGFYGYVGLYYGVERRYESGVAKIIAGVSDDKGAWWDVYEFAENYDGDLYLNALVSSQGKLAYPQAVGAQ